MKKIGLSYNLMHDLIYLYNRFGNSEFRISEIEGIEELKTYNKKELVSKLYHLHLLNKRHDTSDKRVKYYSINLTTEEFTALRDYFNTLNIYKNIIKELENKKRKLPKRIKNKILKLKLR